MQINFLVLWTQYSTLNMKSIQAATVAEREIRRYQERTFDSRNLLFQRLVREVTQDF